MISPLFTTIVIVGLFILAYMKSTTKKLGQSEAEMFERERAANSVRRKPLDNLNYIPFNESCLPKLEHYPNSEIEKAYKDLEKLYNAKIVNLTGISNTDLKFSYGPANLPELTLFDSNYSSLISNLYNLGLEFLSAGMKREAEQVLSYGISLGSDISGNYIALANIYVEDNRINQITELINKAGLMSSITKNSTISKLNQMQEEHVTMTVPLSSPVVKPSGEDIDIGMGFSSYAKHKSSDNDTPIDPGSILPKDILDILDSEPYTPDDQK